MRLATHLFLLTILIQSSTALALQNIGKLKLIHRGQQKSLNGSDTGFDDNFQSEGKYRLVEEFTAHTLEAFETKIGSELEFGVTDELMIGSDTWALVMGIPSFHAKYRLINRGRHEISIGVKSTWLTLDNLADFAPAKDNFGYLNAKIVRPTFAWTNAISQRLKLHTFWTIGIGKVEARLSEKGRRRFWETKHPGGNYETKTTEAPEEILVESNTEDTPEGTETETGAEDLPDNLVSDKNQEKKSSQSSNISRRTLELQSLFGISTDRFQITGEFIRKNGNKILISTRIERMALEDLKGNSLNLTISQQWIADNFQFRIGIGVQYLSITGRDLDGEEVDETGVNPVPEVAFYWRI